MPPKRTLREVREAYDTYFRSPAGIKAVVAEGFLSVVGRDPDALAHPCQNCGGCCRNAAPGIPLGYADVCALITHAGLPHPHDLAGLLALPDSPVWLDGAGALRLKADTESGACVFLRGSECTAYAARPFFCKNWYCLPDRPAALPDASLRAHAELTAALADPTTDLNSRFARLAYSIHADHDSAVVE